MIHWIHAHLLPSAGDYVAALVWIAIAAGIGWAVREGRRDRDRLDEMTDRTESEIVAVFDEVHEFPDGMDHPETARHEFYDRTPTGPVDYPPVSAGALNKSGRQHGPIRLIRTPYDWQRQDPDLADTERTGP